MASKPPTTASNTMPPSPSPSPSPLLTILNFLLIVVGNLFIMSASALVLHNYTFPYAPAATAPGTEFFTTALTHPLLPTPLRNPSTTTFLLSAVLFVLALSSFPPPPHTDAYQGHFLMFALLVSNVYTSTFDLGTVGWEGLGAYMGVLKSVLPGMVVGATVLSLSVHAGARKVGRYWEKVREREEREEREEKEGKWREREVERVERAKRRGL